MLPFYVERLAQAEGATRQAIVMHVTLLTAVYPLGQLVFAPIWGRWSDRTGRRWLLLMGMAATFALHAQAVLNYGPAEVGAVFVVCGLVMAVFQVGASGLLAGRVAELTQIGMGFALMGTSLPVLMMPRGMVSVLALVGVLALEMALISPNLAASISTRGGSRRAGTALGPRMRPTVSGRRAVRWSEARSSSGK